jgi:hypothetical protein
MSDLYSLVYVSSATRYFHESEMEALLAAARTRNQSLGVSGLLLFCEGNFMQVLEGTPEAIDGVYARIAKDPRHHGLIRLVREPIAQREFAGWDMGYNAATAPEFLALSQADWNASSIDGAPSRGRKMLRTFWAACRGGR